MQFFQRLHVKIQDKRNLTEYHETNTLLKNTMRDLL